MNPILTFAHAPDTQSPRMVNAKVTTRTLPLRQCVMVVFLKRKVSVNGNDEYKTSNHNPQTGSVTNHEGEAVFTVTPEIPLRNATVLSYESPYRDDTSVLFLTDNGFHLAEKHHWQRSTLWEEATHVLITDHDKKTKKQSKKKDEDEER